MSNDIKITVTYTDKKTITDDELFEIIFGSAEELYEEYKKRKTQERPSK